MRVEDELRKLRKRLLDTSLRNRLLNHRESRARTIYVVDEKPEEIFNILVSEGEFMEFLPSVVDPQSESIEQESDEGAYDRVWELPDTDIRPDDKHIDRFLQTKHEQHVLQKRLFHLYKKSQEAFDEQGYPVLYLALGFLKWFPAKDADVARVAPLLLIPCELKRKRATAPFHLEWTEDDVQTNISLVEKLKEFDIELPSLEFNEDSNKRGVIEYLSDIRDCVSKKERWEILDDIVLDMFSFTKFVMYKDIDEDAWPDGMKPGDHPIIKELLIPSERLAEEEGNSVITDADLHPKDSYSVLDADPSQIEVIQAIKTGRSLAIEGPPGTGKSQTIANIIAEQLAQNKTVLFVSEKMAALEVVKRRLDVCGLGDFCIELHSRKSNKREFIKELERTYRNRRGISGDLDSPLEELQRSREVLNAYAVAVGSPIEGSRLSPFRLFGLREKLLSTLNGVEKDFPRIELEIPVEELEFSAQECERLLAELQSCMEGIGIPADSAWYGCTVELILPQDRNELDQQINRALTYLKSAESSFSGLSKELGVPEPNCLGEAKNLVQFASHVGKAPNGLVSVIADGASQENATQRKEIIECLEDYSRRTGLVSGIFKEEATARDVSDLLEEYKVRSASLLRFFQGRYRFLRSEIEHMYKTSEKHSRNQIISDLEILVGFRKARETCERVAVAGPSIFGSSWNGLDSDLSELRRIDKWLLDLRLLADVTYDRSVLSKRLASSDFRSRLSSEGKHGVNSLNNFSSELDKLKKGLSFKLGKLFGMPGDRIPFSDLRTKLLIWKENISSLPIWANYNRARKEVGGTFASPVLRDVDSGEIPIRHVLSAFRLAYYDTLLNRVVRERPELGGFDAKRHEARIRAFRKRDRDSLEMNRRRVAQKVLAAQKALPETSPPGSPAGILQGQFERKRGHLSIRNLMTRSGDVIQKVKPCFLMSPLSVAQYLDPRLTRFDTVIFDEGSQVRPEDGIGAILRGLQLVVAGDTRQLPPTSFFDSFTDDEDEEQYEVGASDVESILHQARRSFSSKRLKWHYRSRHESLIAVSNKEFYENSLLIYPSPFASEDSLGLSFRHIADGVYDRGKSRCNRIEARAVAQAVVEHFRVTPDLSLGVGTFSSAQQTAVHEEIETILREQPELEDQFVRNDGENFFVKNLETIQGDERDVIFLSICYGFDQMGKLSTNFGPLNKIGGERRLNVLITRARRKSVVFSNFRAQDLPIKSNSPKAIRALKVFLEYAESGRLTEQEIVGEDTDSPFEDSVLDFLRSYGHEVRKQVGTAGFRIDLAIVNPESPGRYLLGVECDGAMYHSSRMARERDRLRQDILENMGWKNRLYRIWSTDWFMNKAVAQRRLLEAIEAVRTIPYEMDMPASSHAVSDIVGSKSETVDPATISNDAPPIESSSSQSRDGLFQPYVACNSLDISTSGEILAVPPGELADGVRQIVSIEHPIHRDEVVDRLRTFFGKGKAGSKIQKHIDNGITIAESKGWLVRDGEYLLDPANNEIRSRSRASRANPRIGTIYPGEIEGGILLLIERHFGLSREAIVTEVAREFGFRRKGTTIQESLTTRLDSLIKREVIEVDSNGIHLLAGKA